MGEIRVESLYPRLLSPFFYLQGNLEEVSCQIHYGSRLSIRRLDEAVWLSVITNCQNNTFIIQCVRVIDIPGKSGSGNKLKQKVIC